MTWSETHRRCAVLREVETAVTQQGGGPLPWREEYGEVYPDRDALLIALAHRLRTRREAQLDPMLGERELERARGAFELRHAALTRLVGAPVLVAGGSGAARDEREEHAGAR